MRRLHLALAALILLTLSGNSVAQEELLGANNYPQFRVLSGLSGGGFGVRADGAPGIDGAMAYSTPIGYSLAPWRYVIGFSQVSGNRRLSFPDTRGSESQGNRGNGTLAGVVGIPLGRYGNLTFSHAILSGDLDNVQHLQWQIPARRRGLGVSIGAQDVLGGGGSAGTFLPGDGDISRSLFAVVTQEFRNGVFASMGIGTNRFRFGTLNVSAPIGRRFRGVLEFDGFHWNGAIGAHVADFRVGNRSIAMTGMLGLVRGKYAMWTMSVSF